MDFEESPVSLMIERLDWALRSQFHIVNHIVDMNLEKKSSLRSCALGTDTRAYSTRLEVHKKTLIKNSQLIMPYILFVNVLGDMIDLTEQKLNQISLHYRLFC